MRKLVFGVVLAVIVGAAGSAQAAGPSGSTESGNEVTCNHTAGPTGGGVNVGAVPAGNWVYAGTNGAETCSDDGIPLDGRITVSIQRGYVAADGDNSNTPVGLAGCLKVSVAAGGTTPCAGGDSSA